MKPLCYSCLAADGDTGDHIPPYSFFPAPRPNNLIRIPCCQPCNNGNSKEDDYVRFVLTSLIDRSPAADRIWEEKVVPGFLPRNQRVVEDIFPSLRESVLQRGEDNLEAVSFSVDRDRLAKYFTRMVKGLLRYHYPDYNYSQSIFRVRFVLPGDARLQELSATRDLMHYSFRGDGVFQYRHRITDSGLSGLWMLVFYEAILVLVHHTNA